MKFIVFGATGGTGRLVVEQALQMGHQVTVVVRQVEMMTPHPQLTVICGNVLQPSTFGSALVGQDAVISCLGTQKRGATTVYSVGMAHIAAAMQAAGVQRVVCLSAGAVVVPAKASLLTKFVTKYILQRVFGHLYSDMLVMEQQLRHTPLNWTIVRPPWLRDSQLTGQYRVALNEPLAHLTKLSRADLAHYLLACVGDHRTYQSVVEMSY